MILTATFVAKPATVWPSQQPLVCLRDKYLCLRSFLKCSVNFLLGGKLVQVKFTITLDSIHRTVADSPKGEQRATPIWALLEVS